MIKQVKHTHATYPTKNTNKRKKKNNKKTKNNGGSYSELHNFNNIRMLSITPDGNRHHKNLRRSTTKTAREFQNKNDAHVEKNVFEAVKLPHPSFDPKQPSLNSYRTSFGLAEKAYKETKKVYEQHTVIKQLEEDLDILKLPSTIPKLIPSISYIFNYNKDFDNKNEDFEDFLKKKLETSNEVMCSETCKEMNSFGSFAQNSLKVVKDGNYTVFMICIYCLKAYIQSKMKTTSNKTKITLNQDLCSITLDCISNIYNAFTSITIINKDISSIQKLLEESGKLTKAYEAFSEQDKPVQFAILIIILYQLYLKKNT